MNPRDRVVLSALFSGLLSALAPTAALGQERDSVAAAERFDRGVNLAADGDFRGALVEFHAAYEASRNPEVLFNIAAAHEHLNEYVEAEETLARYERLAPPAAFARHRAEVVAAQARLRARIGVLRVRATVSTTACALDGAPMRAVAAGFDVRASVGQHELRCEAEGYEQLALQVDVRGGDVAAVDVALPRRRASIAVVCSIVGAEVRVDGRDVGRTPLREPVAVDEGRHRVEVLHPGYEPAVGEVEARGVGARFDAALRWLDPVPAREASWLVVRASEPGAASSLDGRRHVPDGSVAVPPGRHRLRVERADFVPVDREIDLGLGDRRALEVLLDPTPRLREAYLRDARARRVRWLALVLGGAVVGGAGALWFGLTLPPYLDANARFDENKRLFEACGAIVCPLTRPEYARARDAAAEEGLALLPHVVTSGVLLTIGVGALVTGIVLAIEAPPRDRFDRAPTWHLGLAPGGVLLRF